MVNVPLDKADPASDDDFDVIILGAGIVGCATALLIRQCLPRLRVALLDPELIVPEGALSDVQERFGASRLWADAWRVSAISLSVRAILMRLGLWSEVLARGVCPYHDMVVSDADGTGRFHLQAQSVGEPCLGYIIENNVLLASLRRACLSDEYLQCLSGVSFRRVSHSECAQAFVDVRCARVVGGLSAGGGDTLSLRCKLLVGAQGRGSDLATQLGLPVARRDYHQSALVCQVQTRYPHDWTAWQDFYDAGPLAFLPLSRRADFDPAQEMGWPMAQESERFSSIVWSLPPARAEQLCRAETSQELVSALDALCPAALGGVLRCSVARHFPLVGHLAEKMQVPGVVMVGDAAHGYHPMAGQGLNVGLLDAAVLVDQLVTNDERLADFAHVSGLRRLERQRRLQQRALFELTSALHKLYQRREWWLRVGRNVGLSLFDKAPSLKRLLVSRANAHLTDLPKRFRVTAAALPF